MIYIALLFVMIVAVLITVLPVMRKTDLIFLDDMSDKSVPLEERKRSVYKTLGEIEFDYKMNKLSEKDYKKLNTLYRQKAVNLLKKEREKSGDIDKEIEYKLSQLKKRGNV
ncbi:MAG: hypothetical protein FXF49_08735 [Flexistipes sinusarabici]|uniref:C-type cytochrome biogenesis protein CcmI n=1 Tax=Flexistipes sinusarabici TaxID=2352 RepID=A0A5D0MJ07_FLESI|nr:hypothetical protein [Flexistipes sinusarabici]TYB32956.1 MAG: hypothetical protein FXF49_08735 [Flexistipes sinusarabici]